MKRILVTNYSDTLGYPLSRQFDGKDVVIDAVDTFLPEAFKNARSGSKPYQSWLNRQSPGYMHYELDLSRREGVLELIKEIRPSAIIHSVPHPPLEPIGNDLPENYAFIIDETRNLLEAARQFCWESPFVFVTTDKVYGDPSSKLRLLQKETRWDFADSTYERGISEAFPLDVSSHLNFGGASAAADLLVQEYGHKFNLPTCCLRGPVPTDPWNPDDAIYDPLGSLVRSGIGDEPVPICGLEPKQVREALHANDLAHFIELFCSQPRQGEVYNLGGGRENSYSILEVSRLIQKYTGRHLRLNHQEDARQIANLCYFSDNSKIQRHFPAWSVTHSLEQIIKELVEAHSA